MAYYEKLFYLLSFFEDLIMAYLSILPGPRHIKP